MNPDIKAFFNLKEQINTYYYQYGTNLHNTNAVASIIVNKQIKEIRQATSQMMGLNNEKIVSFQNNVMHCALSIKKFFKDEPYILIANQKITNFWKKHHEENEKITNNIQTNWDVEQLKEIICNNFDQKILLWLSDLENMPFHELDNLIKYLRSLNHKNLFIYCSLDYFILDNLKNWEQYIDFCSIDLGKIFNLFGIMLMIVNPKWIDKMTPVLYGGGMNVSVCEYDAIYKKYPEGLEAGTINPSNILIWGRYLEVIQNKNKEILNKQNLFEELFYQLVDKNKCQYKKLETTLLTFVINNDTNLLNSNIFTVDFNWSYKTFITFLKNQNWLKNSEEK